MKILFLNPRYFEEDYRYKVNKLCPPLGLSILASLLVKNNCDVKILDLEALKASVEDLIPQIKAFAPDIIGVFGTSPIHKYIEATILAMNESCPTSIIIVGGPHATFFPKDLLTSGLKIDYLFRGEAENSILEFINQIRQKGKVFAPEKIPGIAFKTNNGLVIDQTIPRTADLDSMPMPAYDLLSLDRYFQSGVTTKSMTMMTSRGCPNKCIYCVTPILYGHTYRSRSPENVVREMRHLHDRYDIGHIVFYDATFNHDMDRVKQICRLLIEQPAGVTWRARVRADKIDKEMLWLMESSGCVELSFGVETGSERLLSVLKKNETKDQIRSAFQLMHQTGMACSAYFMFGIPGETIADIEETIAFAIELNPDWALFSSATPFPGTEFHDMVKNKIIDHDLGSRRFNVSKSVVSYDELSSDQISDYINLAYERFYLREEWLEERLEKAKSEEQVREIMNSHQFYVDRKSLREQARCAK